MASRGARAKYTLLRALASIACGHVAGQLPEVLVGQDERGVQAAGFGEGVIDADRQVQEVVALVEDDRWRRGRSASGMRARAAVACHNPASSSEPIRRVPSSPIDAFRQPGEQDAAVEDVGEAGTWCAGTPNRPAREGVGQDEAQPGQQRRDEAGALPGG